MNVWEWLVANPIIIVILAIALAFPIVTAIWRAVKKRMGVQTYKDRNNKSANHVRDVVQKYEKKNDKKNMKNKNFHCKMKFK